MTDQAMSIPYENVELVRKACRFIKSNLENPPTLNDLGEHVHMSPFHLQRLFKQVMGVSPREYAEARRIQRLKEELRECNQNVADALYAAGYSSTSRVYESTHEKMGMTPGIYREGGAGMQIEYTIITTILGRMLIATTERGICALHMGDKGQDEALRAALLKEYPAADITENDDHLCDWALKVVEHLNGWQPHLDLPIDVRATAFQDRVWRELRKIPYGETRTYSDIAQAIGQPKAVRAVARACATNPVALVNPCHRIVRSDGEMGGYRWGVERKQTLLEHEKHCKDDTVLEDAVLEDVVLDDTVLEDAADE